MTQKVSKFVLLAAVSGLALSAAPTSALAQATTGAQQAETVVVTGQRGAAQRARAEERLSDTLVSVVSADDVGQFGDQNTAEALQRLPGINIDRNEGEGRTVSVRGLPSSFTQITVNGARVGTSETGDTSVALDVVPSDQLGALSVSKTYTPDMDGDTIGGAVDLRVLSAFSGREQITARLEGTFQEYAEEWAPKGSLTATRRFLDERLGVAVALNYSKRILEGNDLRNDEETGLLFADRGGQRIFYPVEVDARRELAERERLGGTLNLEFRASEAHEFFLRAQYNTLKDDDTRIQYLVELDRSSGAEILGLSDRSLDFIDARVRHQIFFQPTEDQLSAISVGGRSTVRPGGELTYQLDASRSEWTQEDGVRGRFQIDDVRVRVGWSDRAAALLPLQVEPARLPGAARDARDPSRPAAYTFTSLLFIEEERIDDIVTGQLNYQQETEFGGRAGFWKAGVKYRAREKTADKAEFNGTPSAAGVVASYADIATFTPASNVPGFGLMPQLGPARELFFRARDALLAQPTFQRVDQSTASDFSISENVASAYLMASVDLTERLKLIGGVRYEHTEFEAGGFFLESDTDGRSSTGGPAFTARLPTKSNSYGNWLPSLAIRWDINEETVLRASYGRGLKRPDFEEVRNRQEIRFDAGQLATTRRLAAGNPDLRPLVADQFDLSLAFYPSRDTAFQAAAFYKSMTDYFVEISTNAIGDTPIRLPAGVSSAFPFGIVTTINGGDASIVGLELSFNHNFTALPGLASGLFVEGNVTFADSEATVGLRPGEVFAFPGQADLTANLSLGWENDVLSARLAATHTGERLQGLASAARAFEDRRRDAYTQVDVNLRWNVTDVIQVYADGINLNGAQETRFYVGGPAGGVFERVQDFGASYQVGVRARF